MTTLYTGGIAPGAKLVNVRVLGADGTGLTSDVIAGIEWAVDHRLQAQHPRHQSVARPSGHRAGRDRSHCAKRSTRGSGRHRRGRVRRQLGQDGADGRTILGGITSPGNSPFALTVGALNTWATAKRSDDTVTTYSSRGPTRFDLAVKPDVAAPGNKIISLEASGSFLPTMYPFLHRGGHELRTPTCS